MMSSLNVSGTWTVATTAPFGNGYSVVLRQDQAGNISGTMPGCSGREPVSGAVTGSNTFSFSAAMSGGDNECDQVWSVDATMTSDTVASVVLKVWESSDEAESPSPDEPGTMTRNTVPIKLIDPGASGLIDGEAVTQNVDAIAGAANLIYISGAAADGVTQVIVEVTQVQPGDSVQLTLVNENGQQDSTANDGGLFPLGGDPASASSTLTFQAQNTSPPMAIAVWLAPTNYWRGSLDATTVQRSLTIQAQDTNPNPDGSSTTGSQDIVAVRPPVVLIHGLWSNSGSTWAPLLAQQPSQAFQFADSATLWGQMRVQTVDYSAPVQVTATTPPYNSIFFPLPNQVTQSALGFSYNAPSVLLQLQAFIVNYGIYFNVAGVQADVVVHSMGGDIARVLKSVTTPPFLSDSNYGIGSVDKLITIGTPHNGSPLASDLLPNGTADPNFCVRNILARKGNPSFQTATLGTGVVANGAIGDLAAAPANLPATEPFKMAYLAGTTNAANLANIDSMFSASWKLRTICSPLSNPLAVDLTPTLWNNVFGGEANDGVVALSSQLNSTSSTSTNTFPGVIHSPGFEALDFSPPTEISREGGIPDAVINLLNESINGPDFH